MESYSVLMTVYRGVKPEFLEIAIRSMLNQTVPTNDFVIVCDGPLTVELDEIIDRYSRKYCGLFQIIRLPKNHGIGLASNIGIRTCKNDLVAKMDADDISLPSRCRLQLERFEQTPGLTVLGGIIEEFERDKNRPFAIRIVPETNEEIRKFARRRQPFNNVTVMYRREAVLAVGGYLPLRRNEDFDLYVRLLHEGYYAQNLPECLVKVRVDKKACMRRASWSTFYGCVQSRWHSFRIGYASFLDFLVCCAGEAFICICPGRAQQFLYQWLFRKRC